MNLMMIQMHYKDLEIMNYSKEFLSSGFTGPDSQDLIMNVH